MVSSSLAARSSTRISRAALIAIAALFAALLVISRAALGAGHGGGHGGSGHGGSVHSGGSSHVSGSGSRGGSFHGSSHSAGTWRGTSFQRTAFHGSHVGGFHGGFHGGGFHGGGFRHVGFPFFGWNWWGWGWGWGWAPYYSSWWWWGGPGVYVVADDGYGDDGYAADGYGYGGYGRPAVRAGRYAIVKTDVSPEEAQVFLDGKYIGTADDFDGYPDFLYLGPGKYHLEFRLPGYQMYTTDLDVSRGQRLRLDQKLKLEPGKSALDQFPPPSKGTPLGRVFTKGGPEGGDEAAPPAPPRRAQQPYSRRPNDGWSDRDASPGDREEREERIDLRPEPLPRASSSRARMRFKVSPEDAAVYVDDKYLGAGEDLAANPRGVVTDPGKHSITVARPGYKTKTVDVTVRVGAPVDVVVELEK